MNKNLKINNGYTRKQTDKETDNNIFEHLNRKHLKATQ